MKITDPWDRIFGFHCIHHNYNEHGLALSSWTVVMLMWMKNMGIYVDVMNLLTNSQPAAPCNSYYIILKIIEDLAHANNWDSL